MFHMQFYAGINEKAAGPVKVLPGFVWLMTTLYLSSFTFQVTDFVCLSEVL